MDQSAKVLELLQELRKQGVVLLLEVNGLVHEVAEVTLDTTTDGERSVVLVAKD